MKICFVCNEYPPGPHGGIGTFTQILARYLVKNGHSVKIIGVYSATYPGPSFRVDDGIEIYRIDRTTGRFGWLLDRWRLARWIREKSRNGEIEIIECPDFEGWGAFRLKGSVPLVIRLHGSCTYFALEQGKRPKLMTQLLEKRALLNANGVCSVSKYTLDKTITFFGLALKKAQVIYNAIDQVKVNWKTPDSERTPVVIYSGTLTAKKGVQELMLAWNKVSQMYPDAILEVYGKDGVDSRGGSMKRHLESLVLPPGKNQVRFMGHVARSQLHSALCTASAAVFPSKSEAFPFGPLEAMALGCPTVASRAGSGPEMIEHGIEGLLIDPLESDSIAEAILALLAQPEFAKTIGAAGRKKVTERFSITTLANQSVAFYKSVLSYQAGQEMNG